MTNVTTRTTLTLSALALLASLAGCDGTATDEQPVATNAKADEKPAAAGTKDEAVVHQTVVVLNADGTKTVREHDITAVENAKQQADHDLFVQGKFTPAYRDFSCAGADMWLFTGTNRTGAQICFITSTAQAGWQAIVLSDYSWAGRVRSFFGGVDTSAFIKYTAPSCSSGPYNPYALRDTVDYCTSVANELVLCRGTTAPGGGC